MVNADAPIETQLCLSPKSRIPGYVRCFPSSAVPNTTTEHQASALSPTPWEQQEGSWRVWVCSCLSMCVSERYFISQVLWLISVTKISFMTIPIC